MLHYHRLGEMPAKHHIVLRDADGKLMMEQCVTREGFLGQYSILYYRDQPIAECALPEPLSIPGFSPFELVGEQRSQRRHVLTQNQGRGGDFLHARRTYFVNNDVHIGVLKPDKPAERFFSNGDGDELYFIKEGHGVLESLYGMLPFREHDYVLIPKGTPYRLHFADDKATALVFEGRPWLNIPGDFRNSSGQLTMFAPYCHRDFRIPTELLSFDAAKHKVDPFEMVIKRSDQLTIHRYDAWPFDVVGWDGTLYPVAFNIHDYQAKAGHVHLPPTSHTTFAGNGFVVCSFVPRKVDFHKEAIPCPYGHASVDMDEILYYVEGNFASRKGIHSESISLHPMGIPHGPHPGMYEKSIGAEESNELAVMCDTHRGLHMTTVAAGLEDPEYHKSWIEKEDGNAH